MQHFVDMNVQGIILSSFYLSHTQNLDPANPNPDFGYEVIDHKDIDPIYGTLEDLDELIAEAHDKGTDTCINIFSKNAIPLIEGNFG